MMRSRHIDGSVDKYCRRAIIAFTRCMSQYIAWPEAAERAAIKARIEADFDIPDCLGFVDGTHINLNCAPSKGHGNAGSFHSRKERYGFLYVAVCDDRKRFRFVHWGLSAASSDQRAQRLMRTTVAPQDFFDDGEHILADSGFTCSPTMVPMYRRMLGQKHIYGQRVSSAPEDRTDDDRTGLLQR